MHDHIIAGFDGSRVAAAAVRWAAQEAERRNAGLTVVACYSIPPITDFGLTGVPALAADIEALRTATQKGVDTLVGKVREIHPALAVTALAVQGLPRTELPRLAEHADLMVLGSTGTGQAAAWLLGSVAHAVVRTSPCAVALVPAGWQPDAAADATVVPRVVVGVDESEQARAALDWAIDEADLRGTALTVVHAWLYPYALESPVAAAHDFIRVDAEIVLERAVERANARGGAAVDGRLVEGNPAEAIIDAADAASVVVVGSRGRGGLRSLLLGSVSSAVICHAPCPTVVVRTHHAQA